MKKIKQFKSTTYKAKNSFSNNKKEKSLYDQEKWKKYSQRFLKHNPKCYICGAKSQVTDHIIAHKGDEILFWNPTNYIPVCFRCHSTLTGLFDRYNPPKVKEKMEHIAREREIREVAVRVLVVPITET